MEEYKAEFIQRVQRTPNVFSFRFITNPKLNFIPGQFAQLILDPNNESYKNLIKYLSFSNAPSKNYVEFTKKLTKSEFSNKLMSLNKGSKILLRASMGNCFLNENSRKVGFLSGGIGITPAISIIEHIVTENKPINASIIYSNWTAADIAFRQELENWSSSHNNIKLIHVLVDCHSEDKGCYPGMITKELIQEKMPDYLERELYIFGPPAMVKNMTDICYELGCDKSKIYNEKFIGY